MAELLLVAGLFKVPFLENALVYNHFSAVIDTTVCNRPVLESMKEGLFITKLHYSLPPPKCRRALRSVALIRFGLAISRTSAGLVKIPVFQMQRHCYPMI